MSKDNVEAKLTAHVLKDGKVDTSDWSFTVEGASSSMDIATVTTGEVMGEVVIGEAIDFNGTELDVPDTATLAWTANDGTQTVTGTIPYGFKSTDALKLKGAKRGKILI